MMRLDQSASCHTPLLVTTVTIWDAHGIVSGKKLGLKLEHSYLWSDKMGTWGVGHFCREGDLRLLGFAGCTVLSILHGTTCSISLSVLPTHT